MEYIVYIKIDSKSRITEINSSAFLSDISDWKEIDKGDGVRYHHAQANYLPKPLIDENGVYRYKYTDGIVLERTAEEMAADMPVPAITQEQRLTAAENAIEEIINLIMEG